MSPRRGEPAGGHDPPAGSVFPRISRRRFLALGTAGGAAVLAGDALIVEPRAVQLTRHTLNARTSPEQRPLRVMQISDLHLRSVGRMHRRIAAMAHAERPDLLLFTGDSLDRADGIAELGRLLALFPRGVPGYAILGNWEHWGGVDLDDLAAAYRRAGIRLLVNETAIHDAGGRSLALTGLDDLVGGRPDAPRAFAAVPACDAHLLLAHCPEHRDRLRDAPPPAAFGAPRGVMDFDLARITAMLSGHTHGGQVNVLGWTPVLPPGSGRYVHGWFRDPGAVPLYVSRGIGTSVMPVRFGARPEVALFTMWV